MNDLRSGLGFDVHAHEVGRPLYLAGVRFDESIGLAGHSDADVVCHALADALLGAAVLGDVGEHFPDTDPAVAGIAGLDLLAGVVGMLLDNGFRASSCDVVVIAERPAIGPHREEMRMNLAATLGVDVSRVSVKATRPEGMGLTGDGAACMATAVVVTA
jgi:2-C-methyl-D-erythritol 2,4-cyclodiphosphate synthase